jgi:hypothetical protein
MSSSAASYERLAQLFERDLQLAGEGRWEELSESDDERSALIASLGESPEEAARASLVRASALAGRTTIELMRGRDALLIALDQLERARRTARGYTPPQRRAARIEASA